MWDRWCCCCCFKPINKKHFFSLYQNQHPYHQNLLPIQIEDENDDILSNQPIFSTIAMIFTSWLRRSTSRYLILALCSPLLLPLFCTTFPFLCALEIFYRLCRRRRRRKRTTVEDSVGDVIRPCEESENGGKLLQRYLEDQLILVAGSVYECGDDEDDYDDGADIEYVYSTSPSLK